MTAFGNNRGNAVTAFGNNRSNAVTAFGNTRDNAVTVFGNNGSNAVTVFGNNRGNAVTATIESSMYAAKWQTRMFYCFHTHHEFDVEDISVTGMDDDSYSDDDCVYGKNTEKLYHKVSGQDREDGLELPVDIAWADAMATLVEEGGWTKNLIQQKTQKFGYCPCSDTKEYWRRQKSLWGVQENKDSMDEHPHKF